MNRTPAIIALLGSTGTLMCCVLPALLVALGFGSTVAAAISAVPQITWLSEHKLITFFAAGTLLAAGFWLRARPEAQTCPTDPTLARECQRARRASGMILWTALGVFTVADRKSVV